METLNEETYLITCKYIFIMSNNRDYKEKLVDSYCTFNKDNNNITFVLAVSVAFKVLASDRFI
jgi:hypothetical protein